MCKREQEKIPGSVTWRLNNSFLMRVTFLGLPSPLWGLSDCCLKDNCHPNICLCRKAQLSSLISRYSSRSSYILSLLFRSCRLAMALQLFNSQMHELQMKKLHCVYVCRCICAMPMLKAACECQRSIYERWFSPSTMWVLGTEFGLGSKCVYPLGHLAGSW